MKLLGIEMTHEEFDKLMCEQAKGKELKVINNQVVAIDRQPTQEEICQQEITDLKKWFDTEYTKNEQKYRRLHTLQQLCDNGSTPYDMLIWLYKEAEVKRKRIQELEVIINE